MRTGEVASRAEVSVETLRYYERRGLLAAPARSPAGYRCYPPETVRVVRFIKRAQEVGFTLADVEELLDLAGGGPENCDSVAATARARVADLERRMADLASMRDALARLAATCERSRVRRDCPLLDSLDPGPATKAGATRAGATRAGALR